MSHSALNGGQFTNIVQNTLAGGDTVDLRTGNRPKKGFAVADPDREVRVQAENFDESKVARYVGRHRDALLSSADPEAHLGTWRESEGSPRPSDTVYMDTSRVYPTAFHGYVAGMKYNQKAIYDLDSGTEIPVRQVKYRDAL